MVYEFKHNDKAYLEVQNIAEDKVETFLTDNNTTKLLEFAFVAINEGLRKDPQREVLIEKTPPLQNFNFTIGQLPFSNIYDYYPHIAKEKVLESANKLYNELYFTYTMFHLSTIISYTTFYRSKVCSDNQHISFMRT